MLSEKNETGGDRGNRSGRNRVNGRKQFQIKIVKLKKKHTHDMHGKTNTVYLVCSARIVKHDLIDNTGSV